MLYSILMIIHVLIAVVLVLLILIQSSKGGGLDGMMGVATNVLGGQAAPGFLKKATIISALLFMFSCFFLAFHLSAARKVSSTAVEKIRKERTEKQTTELPVTLPESGNVLDTEPVPLKSE